MKEAAAVNEDKFEERLLSLIAEAVPAKFKKQRLTTDMHLQRDLGLDSIGMLALLFRFEQTFGLDLAAVDLGVTLGQMRTVGDALAVSRDVLQRVRAAEGA